MLSDNGRKVKNDLNYHMTHEEVKILYNHIVDHCQMKYEIYFWLALTRVMRPSEVLAINIMDFKHWARVDYSRLTFREAKTNKIRSNELIIEPVANLIKQYVITHNLKNGFLFPWHNRKNKTPFVYEESELS